MNINPDKEKKTLEIQRRSGVISEHRYQMQMIRLKYPNLEQVLDVGMTIELNWNEIDDRRFASCHRCRRDRDHLLCMSCPRYNRRNWFESLEIGICASIGGLLMLIVIFYGIGVK